MKRTVETDQFVSLFDQSLCVGWDRSVTVFRYNQFLLASNIDNVEACYYYIYYLVKGLSHVNFYWGTVRRYVQLKKSELEDYQPGELITWLQFSSADRSGKDIFWLQDRNTVFIIWSLTGRSIRSFSNCCEEEDEVLFLPHSSFFVCHVEYNAEMGKHHIYMTQVGILLSDLSLLIHDQ